MFFEEKAVFIHVSCGLPALNGQKTPYICNKILIGGYAYKVFLWER
jgi:hypothetical protein